ncbi:aminoglycoside 6-adenylyltransferase [Paenibacillus sp. L3-i20]|uniref:aminoglycoside 6-adenylyltransferase n=1 Tax=Paenibacillus sp. L3-i20 TaxID=2905833 RepID=UPI001EDD4BF4|nr:aminoglycoside 6-adenylyltransferase [Paenibacillus sp. L3-i20]GKU77646.1 aminoglycoside 6-adenylyltransferase [Paenibacillus sp. L3-i20]
MRTEEEMMRLIMRFAEQEPRIRAVIMNGSRINPHAVRDRFQDYDIVYFVTDVREWTKNREWVQHFGDILIMQTPDDGMLIQDEPRESFAFLMQFTDGNRIDLTLSPVEQLEGMHHDSLSLVLLDKDNRIGTLPHPSINDYRTKPPTAAHFLECCNEFWWVNTYIAKGLWRGELYYSKFHLEGPVREMLIYMLDWYIGVSSNYESNPGKLGKYYEELLPPVLWRRFVSTFPDADEANIWRSLFAMGDLFRETASVVADHYGFNYNEGEDQRVTAYLKHIQSLPQS